MLWRPPPFRQANILRLARVRPLSWPFQLAPACPRLFDSLHRQNLSSLLPFFSCVIVTFVKQNILSLKNLLAYFCFEKQEKAKWIKKLLTWTKPFHHFILDTNKLTIEIKKFSYVPSAGESSQKKKKCNSHRAMGKRAFHRGQEMPWREATAYASAEEFLSTALIKSPRKAQAIFRQLFMQLPKKKICPHTLLIRLQTSRGKTHSVSLVDYISLLVNPEEKPSKILTQFHRYIKETKKVLIPRTYIQNPKFA